jgi:galactose mutarotase-like enzyme
MRIAAQRWQVEVRPERGGRITSLRLDGEEILDQGIGVDQPTAKGFVEGGAFGWDEMVPNLEPTDKLPDHGEAWRLPWRVAEQDAGSIAMSCDGTLVSWRLWRQIALDQNVDVRYRYTNIGKEPHAAYWCAHPLFKYEPGMEIDAPVPHELTEGTSTKVFLPPGAVDRVALRWRSGKGIAVSWDASETPDVAIWMCNGDLGGYRQIAIEPGMTSPMLSPGSSLSWWLRISPL